MEEEARGRHGGHGYLTSTVLPFGPLLHHELGLLVLFNAFLFGVFVFSRLNSSVYFVEGASCFLLWFE